MEIRTPYDNKYDLANDIRQRMDVDAVMEMARTNLFTEKEINELGYQIGTWGCLIDGEIELHTGLTPNKTADLLGVAGETVRSWVKKGKIEAYRDVAGFWNIPYQEVIRLVRERR